MADFHVGLRELIVDWMGPAGRLAALLAPLAWIVWMAASTLAPIEALATMTVAIGGGGVMLFFRFGLNSSLQQEFACKLPVKIAALLGLPQKSNRIIDR